MRKKLRSTPARVARGNTTYESNAAKARRRQEPTPTKKTTAAKAKDRKTKTLAERTTAIQFREKPPSQKPSKGLKPQNPLKGSKTAATTARHSSGSSAAPTARPASKQDSAPRHLSAASLAGNDAVSQRVGSHLSSTRQSHASNASHEGGSQSLSAPSRPPTQAPVSRPQPTSADNQGTVNRTQPTAFPSRPGQPGAATAPPRLGDYPDHSAPLPRSHPTAPIDFANANQQSYAEPDDDHSERRDDLDGRALRWSGTGRYENGQADEFGAAPDGEEWAGAGHEDWEWDPEFIGDEEHRGQAGAEGEDEVEDEDEDEDGEEEGRGKGGKGGKQGRAAAGHPEYSPFLMRTARRARSIIITRSPMPSPEQEYQAACDAWEYVTKDSCFQGEPFPEKLYSIVQQHNPTIRGRLKAVAVSLLSDYFKFSDPNFARNRRSNRQLYRAAVDDDAFLHEFPDEKKNRWFCKYAVRILQKVFFHSRRADGFNHQDLFHPVPLPLLAVTFTAIRCALDEWARGSEERVQFRIPEYEAILESHLSNLQALKRHNTQSIQTIQEWYWKKASGGKKKLRGRAVSKPMTGQELAATSAEIAARQSSEADYDDDISIHDSDEE